MHCKHLAYACLLRSNTTELNEAYSQVTIEYSHREFGKSVVREVTHLFMYWSNIVTLSP